MCLLPKLYAFHTWDKDIAILTLTPPIDINVPTRNALPWLPEVFFACGGRQESSVSVEGRSREKYAAHYKDLIWVKTCARTKIYV